MIINVSHCTSNINSLSQCYQFTKTGLSHCHCQIWKNSAVYYNVLLYPTYTSILKKLFVRLVFLLDMASVDNMKYL